MSHPPWRLLALVGVSAALVLVPLAMSSSSKARGGHTAQTLVARAPAGEAPAPHTQCAGPPPGPADAGFEAQVVKLVNAQRRAAGLPPLKRVERLTESARWFARDMASQHYFAQDHDTYYRERGHLVRACDWSARIAWYYPQWTALAENIAAGYQTPEEAVAGWMSSPGHRAKILGHGHWETGAGYWAGGSEGHYWVEDFGRRSGVFPLVIDDEAGSTASPRVSLYVYGSWREMRLRNDDQPFGPWRTFSNAFDWTLDDTPGTRTVTVEMRDGGKAASSSDSIELGRPQPPT
ncbi:MAG TPA: CAP domain-containing protein [Vicinamibacteria bacterium]|nr:CAP domain-containing protein [Vicinamibacteria bacterium]